MLMPLQTAADIEPESGITGVLQQIYLELVATYGPAGPFYAVAAIGLLVALAALPAFLRKQKDPLERFSFREERLDDDLVSLRQTDDGNLQGLAPLLEPTNQEELSATRKDLHSAGYKDASAVRVFFLAKVVLGLGLLCFGLLLTFLIPDEPDVVFATLISGALGMFGYFMPVYWVKRQIETRREDIQNSFPDAMDMMLVCIEGGQSLDQAMARVGEEMKTSSGALSEELQVVTHEFRAGKDRSSVLRDFAERCSVNDISSFVTVLIQSSQFGTSVSQALRVYAAEMRDKRLIRAEEKANLLPTKLTLGTMAFTVPPLILILVGPSFIQILRSLSQFAG